LITINKDNALENALENALWLGNAELVGLANQKLEVFADYNTNDFTSIRLRRYTTVSSLSSLQVKSTSKTWVDTQIIWARLDSIDLETC
jgi:hypothetical protein